MGRQLINPTSLYFDHRGQRKRTTQEDKEKANIALFRVLHSVAKIPASITLQQ